MSEKCFAGVMISEAPFANLPVLFQGCGLDFVVIDGEHGAFDYGVLSALLMNARLCGLRTIVRLPDNQRREITRLMDMGAGGLLLPMTNCAEDIARVVEYAKYAPLGHRGISTTRAHTSYHPPALEEYMETANQRTLIFAQIETRAGVEEVDAILAVPGVAGVMVGPNDLACDLGCMGREEELLEPIGRVARAARKAGKSAGIITAKKRLLEYAGGEGMRWFCIGSELNMLQAGCRAVVEQVSHLMKSSEEDAERIK